MNKKRIPMNTLVLQNCKVTICVPKEMLEDDEYTIRIEDENGLIYDDRMSPTCIHWDSDQDFLFAVKTRLAVAKDRRDDDKRMALPSATHLEAA